MAKLERIPSGGQLHLDDGMSFRIASDQYIRVSRWIVGDEIAVSDSGNLAWRLRLTNVNSGAEALAIPSTRA
jgi:hypothetical protein